MKRIVFLLIPLAAVSIVAFTASISGQVDKKDNPTFDVKIPSGYRDWKLISVAHEAGNLNDLRAILGNDIAINAYRKERLPLLEGAVIARLAWSYVPSEENNRVFGQAQSFVAGSPINVQFMVKDSKKYASTGAPVCLHRDLADPELRTGLFIQHSGNYQCHDFALAMSQ